MVGEQFLLVPGPTPIPDRVSRAMSRPMINHRGPEFREMLEEVTAEVKNICCTRDHLIIYPSSGTGALEAAVTNFISPGDKVLAITMGVFGERFADIAASFGARVERMAVKWGQAADPDMIRERMLKDPNREIKALLVTHNETSTGVYNDIKMIREAMGEHPALFMVDAVSSLSALELKMDAWGIDVILSGSQKAFMIPPGLSFMTFSERALKASREADNPRYYWDVSLGLKYLEKGQTAFTPAISLFYGLREALTMLKEEGLENIIARHKKYRTLVRTSVRAMGLELLAHDNHASPSLTSVIAPASLGSNRVRQYMSEKFNIVMAGGQQQLDDVIFRIGHLGYIRELDLLSVMAALEITLAQLGHDITLGVGVSRAQKVILENI